MLMVGQRMYSAKILAIQLQEMAGALNKMLI